MIRSTLLSGGLVLGLVLGCRVQRDNPDHCFHARGDATCLERYPDASLPYCVDEGCGDAPFGCVAELPEPSCYSPCGGDSLLGEGECEVADGETGTGTEGGSESGSESGVPSDLPPEPECALDSDCLDREGTRFCIDGSCEPCTNMPDPGLACATRDPSLPVCHADECVTCFGEDQALCSAQSQICVEDGTSCGPCTNHDQCPGGAACHILDGVCFPADAVWHIDGDGGRDFGNLDALFDIAIGEAATFILHELDGGAIYQDRILVDSQSIAVLAAPGEHPRVSMPQNLGNAPTIAVFQEEGVLYLRGCEFRGEQAMLVTVQARAHVDSTELYASSGPAIRIYTDAHLVMRNSMVRGGTIDPAVLRVQDLGSFDVVNSSLVGLDADPLDCPTLPKVSSLRNSILVGPAGVDLSTCADFSILMDGNALSKAIPNEPDNTVIGGFQASWFVEAIGYDLHLTPNVPLSLTTAATWQAGDPLTDFDGDPRPIGPEVTDWAGADVPSP